MDTPTKVKTSSVPKDGKIIYNRVFVGGLAHETSETELEVFFSDYGEVLDVRIVYDRKTGKNKGYGFITFNQQRSSTKLIDLDTVSYKGRKLRLRQAVRKHITQDFIAKKYNSAPQCILVPVQMAQPESPQAQVTPQISNYTYGYPDYYANYSMQPVMSQPQYITYISHPGVSFGYNGLCF